MTTTQALIVGETAIRQHDGLYSLNDLHRASGGEIKHQPTNFIRLETTQALITELCSSDVRTKAIDTVRGRGKDQGTYACKELVIAYAAWINPAFQLKVIRVFLGTVAAPQQALPLPVPTKTLTFTVPVNDRNRRWLLHTDRTGREIVTELSPETHVITNERLAYLLMVSPADLCLTVSQMLNTMNACQHNLRTSTGLYAKRLNIQPAEPPKSARDQFSSLGVPGELVLGAENGAIQPSSTGLRALR